MPLQGAGKHGPVSRRGLVHALEESGAESSAIDDRIAPAEALQRGAVENAAPFAVAAPVELLRVLELKECFRFAITGLLAQIGAHVLSAVMPDKRAGRKSDPVAGLLQSPANIHVIARLAVMRIEAVDRLQNVAAKGHVATGNVLGLLIALQHMGGLTRRGRHAGGQP